MTSRLTILAFAATALFAAGQARAAPQAAFEYAQPGDLNLNCHEISLEVSAMEMLIMQARSIQDSSEVTATGVTVAKTVGSYLVGSLAGGIGVVAAGYLLSEATDNKAEDALLLENAAEQRRSFMAGIYNAKGCHGPLDLASIEPAAGDNKSAAVKLQPRKPRYNE